MNRACYHPEFIGAVRSIVPRGSELQRLWYHMMKPAIAGEKRAALLDVGWERFGGGDAVQLPREFV